jgi:transcriptional regulator with XRE-family HTH domain
MNLRRSEKLPRKLLAIRDRLDLSAEELLKELGITGDFSAEDIFDWEEGKSEPPAVIVLLYAILVNISTDVLIDDRRRLPKVLPTKKKH